MQASQAETGTTVFARLMAWLEDRKERARLKAELDALPAADRARVLAELGLQNETQLHALIDKGPDGAAEFDALLRATGVDRSEITGRGLQTMEANCTMCRDKGKCRSCLDAGTLEEFGTFCPNAYDVAAVKASQTS